MASDTAPSAKARRQCESLQAHLGNDDWDLEVVDVFERPDLADVDRVLATPVLIRLLPQPRMSVIGDFGDFDAVASALDLEKGTD